MKERGRGRPRTRSGARKGFALRFYRARKARGLSQVEAAEALGVALSTVARWETGFTEPGGLARRYVEGWMKGGSDGTP